MQTVCEHHLDIDASIASDLHGKLSLFIGMFFTRFKCVYVDFYQCLKLFTIN